MAENKVNGTPQASTTMGYWLTWTTGVLTFVGLVSKTVSELYDTGNKASKSELSVRILEYANQVPWIAVCILATTTALLATRKRWLPRLVYFFSDEKLSRDERRLQIEEKEIGLAQKRLDIEHRRSTAAHVAIGDDTRKPTGIDKLWLHLDQRIAVNDAPYYSNAIRIQIPLLGLSAIDISQRAQIPLNVAEFLVENPQTLPRPDLWPKLAAALCLRVEYFGSGPPGYDSRLAMERLRHYVTSGIVSGHTLYQLAGAHPNKVLAFVRNTECQRCEELGLDAKEVLL